MVEPPVVRPADVLRRAARDGIDDGALGRLVRSFSDWLLRGSRLATLRLLLSAGLVDRLASPDFIDGLGAGRLKARHVIALAFRLHEGAAGGAVELLSRLAAAGALEGAARPSAVSALHAGMSAWHAVGPKAALVAAIAAEFDTFEEAGAFLAAVFESDASRLAPDEAAALLRAVLRDPDVRDLAGDAAALLAALPDFAREVSECLLADADGSDADADGNLAGFVVSDGDASASSYASSDDGDDDGSDSGDGSSDGGRARGASGARAGRHGNGARAGMRRSGGGRQGGERGRVGDRGRRDASAAVAASSLPRRQAGGSGRGARTRDGGADSGIPAGGGRAGQPQGRTARLPDARASDAGGRKRRRLRDGGAAGAAAAGPRSRYLDADAGVGLGSDDDER